MCHCRPGVKTPNCGSMECMQAESKINHMIEHAKIVSVNRSQEVLKEKGGDLSFNDLLAAVYFQAVIDLQKK